MKFKFLKSNFKVVISSLVTVSLSSVGLFNFLPKDKFNNSFVKGMIEALEEQERLDEISITRVNYPENASAEQRGYIEQILKFERDNGLCQIMFVNNDRDGSHYRVENDFWVGEGKFVGRNILKEFVGIISSEEIADKCRSAGVNEKVFIKNDGKKVWRYFQEDQGRESFKKWISSEN